MSRRPTNENARGPVAGGRYSYDGLDRVIHEKARLGILASLASNARGLLFNDLKQLCSLTDGNLSRHLTVLSDAGLVQASEGGSGRRPRSVYSLTVTGRRRFAEYISVLERVVTDAHADAREGTRPAQARGRWSGA